MRRASPIVEAYRLLLRLLPPPIRDQDGEEMAVTFEAMWEGTRGSLARARCVARSFGRLPLVAAIEWWDHLGAGRRARRHGRGGGADMDAMRRGFALGSWVADIRYAARRLRARPAYSSLAVLTMALGLGGAAAVFGITRGLLFDPLPYANEEEIGVFWKKTDWTEGEFLHIRSHTPGFQQVALYRLRNLTLSEDDAPARLVPGIVASAELFEVLGTSPLLGRGFRAGEDAEGAEPVAVLSYGLWRDMGGSPSLVGERVMLDGQPHTVVGVMPRGFWFPDPSVRLWTTLALDPEAVSWNSTLIGRVATGHDLRRMAEPLTRLTVMLDERFDYPERWDKTVGAAVTPVREDMVGSMRPALFATLGAMGLLLLIACANVAALMLGQVDQRSTELAVRLALGAGRRRLTQQLLLEALLLALGAALLGIALAWTGFRALASALPLGPWADASAPDWTLFISAMTIALAAALLVALVPAVSLWRGDLGGAMARGRSGGGYGRGGRLEGGLVVAEVALAVLIASGAALLARSVGNLYALDPGVSTELVGVVDVMVGGVPGRSGKGEAIDQLTTAISGLPGVRSAGATQVLPLRGGGYNLPITIEGQPDVVGQSTEFRTVTPGYLETVGIGSLAGRTIDETDVAGAEVVVVINEAVAERYFKGIDPIGRLIGDGIDGRLARVVGVVSDAAERRLTDGGVPVRYVALAQTPWVDEPQSVVFRTDAGVDPVGLLEEARRTVQRIAPAVPIRGTTTLSRMLDESVGPARPIMSLIGVLAALALILGAVGIYGVTLHLAARRQREWAIRMALGLSRSRAIGLVVAHGSRLVGLGIGLGMILTVGFARLLSSLLYGVGALDPVALGAAVATLLTVGVLAAWVPAWRAGKTDPATILRGE